MTRTLAFVLALSPLTEPFLPGAQPDLEQPADGDVALITVRVYDYARTGDRVLALGKLEAQRLLSGAGVAAGWEDCPLTMDETARNQACAADLGDSDLLVRILPERMHRLAQNSPSTLGQAMITNRGPPRFASVLFGNIERIAFGSMTGQSSETAWRLTSLPRRLGVLLGHVIAHEIGHLLLESGAHTSGGLMEGSWNPDRLEAALTGSLAFHPQRARLLRRGLRRRSSGWSPNPADPLRPAPAARSWR